MTASPGIAPTIWYAFPSRTSVRARYISPPHSAYTGRPAAIASRIAARSVAFASSSGAKCSGKPPPMNRPSTSGSAWSASVSKGTSVAPAAASASRSSA